MEKIYLIFNKKYIIFCNKKIFTEHLFKINTVLMPHLNVHVQKITCLKTLRVPSHCRRWVPLRSSSEESRLYDRPAADQ